MFSKNWLRDPTVLNTIDPYFFVLSIPIIISKNFPSPVHRRKLNLQRRKPWATTFSSWSLFVVSLSLTQYFLLRYCPFKLQCQALVVDSGCKGKKLFTQFPNLFWNIFFSVWSFFFTCCFRERASVKSSLRKVSLLIESEVAMERFRQPSGV